MMSDYDLIIRGGRIVDGSGSEPFVGDVAIKDGTICEVSPKVEGSSDHEVDASGKTVTPGFVDVHTHYDGQATWDNHLNPSSALGTTTVITGNCGVGFAPCKPQLHHHELVKHMFVFSDQTKQRAQIEHIRINQFHLTHLIVCP